MGKDILETLREYEDRVPHLGDGIFVTYRHLQEAADEIERLRSLVGAARLDPGFREITGQLQRRSTEPPING